MKSSILGVVLCIGIGTSALRSTYAWAQTGSTTQPTTQPVEPDSTIHSNADPANEPDVTVQSDVVDPDEVSADEMAELEAALAADEGEADPPNSSKPAATKQSLLDIAVILDVAAAYFSDDPDQRGGHDPNGSGFTLQQLELSIGANVDPYFRFDGNLVFTLFGVEVEEAYASTLALPYNLALRAGQFLTRFGRLNSTHPHSWSFLDQPLVNGKFFGGEGSRGLGAELSWLAPLPWYALLTGSINNADGECCARSFIGGETLPIDGVEDFLYTTSLKQTFPFSENSSLSLGLSAQFGPNATGFGNRTEIYGADLYFRFRPVASTRRTALSWTAEAMFRSRQVPRDVLQDLGLYTQLVWSIDPRWEIGARYEYVSGVEDDLIDPEWSSDRQRVAIQGTFYPSHFSRVRLQPMLDDIPGRAALVHGVMLNLEILAGAHGAHQF